ncbi:MAG: phage regulatory CII family protein [Burkholderiales bacterium]|nr:phage regulatory CII family protein [Burkholderiales bacterium]
MPDSHSLGLKREPGIDTLEALRRAVYEYVDPTDSASRGVPAVAKKMGLPAGTLYNKLNYQNDELRHVPSVPDMIQIVGITGDLRILAALNHTFGCVCFPVPDLSKVSDSALLELVNRIGAESGDFHRAINNALTAKTCSAKAVATVQKEGFEYMGAIVETMARMPGLIDGR